MSEQMEHVNDALEGDEVQDDYEGDLGDGAKKRGSGAALQDLGSA